MLKTVDVIAEALKKEGVDRIFGMPGGGSSTDLLNAVKKKGIEPILSCHEASSAIIASVYGEIKDTVGACFSTMGPGAANLAGGIAYAYLERLPLLAFTECHGLRNSEFLFSQRIDQRNFFAPITKNSFTIISSNAQDVLERAINITKKETPGPVHLDLPIDEAAKEASYQNRKREKPLRLSGLSPGDQSSFAAANEKIGRAKCPVIIAGIEAKREGAGEALTALAEKMNVPVMISMKGRGVFDEAHPLYGGIFMGAHTRGTFEDAVTGRSDLLIVVGLDPVELMPRTWGSNLPVIHIGAQPNIHAVYPAEMEIVGDIKTILDILRHNPAGKSEWDPRYLQDLRDQVKNRLSFSRDDLPLHRIIQIAREKLPSDGVLSTDIGAFNSMVYYLWQVRKPKTFFNTKGLGTMAFALPAAIAARLALPDKKVLCFTGDGGFLMRVQELEMCSRLDLPIIIVVFSDSALGLIKIKQQAKGIEPIGVQLKNPDFPSLIRSFGGVGFRATTENEFRNAMETAVNSDKLSLIEAVLNPETYGEHLKLIRG